MSAYLDPYAAWLAGAGFSGLTPVQPGRASLTPVDPYAALAGYTPVDPYAAQVALTPVDPGNAAATPVDPGAPRAAPLPTQAPPPRRSVDPPWVFLRGDALTTQALRRSHAKTVRAPDEWLPDELIQQAARQIPTLNGTHLWRWAPEFRVKAVACELINRTQVLGHEIWVLRTPAGPPQARLRMDGELLFSLRGPWPAIVTADQIDRVVRAATEREDRIPEILAQADGFWPFFESVLGFPLSAAPAAVQVFALADDWAQRLLMLLKHNLAIRRPAQTSSRVTTVIPTPGHGSLPSGHATLAAMAAELLRQLIYPRASLRSQQLDRLARRIAFNRVVAGVHMPVDSQVGYALGTQLARLLAAWARGSRAPLALRTADILRDDYALDEDGAVPPLRAGAVNAERLPNLHHLWRQASAELRLLRG